ncbi:MAG: DUF1036 domain-containing protein [Solirubrobacterales bacterium]|nr:DUF1036 domain-containing protein [Solirubrobacterales bacterium]
MSTDSLGSGRRRLVLLSAALACACTLLASLLAVNAHAAGKVVVARPSARSVGALRLEKPLSGSRVSRGRMTPDVSPFGTSVNFRNSYGQTVWVGIERYSCNGWENQGWYAVSPGETVTAFSTTNRYAYFYAQAANGAYWGGNYEGVTDDYYPWYSPGYDYGGCSNIGSTAETPVGMRQVDLGGWNLFDSSYTINLVP